MQPLPRWSRITLVAAAVIFAAGLCFASYRYVTQPVTLTVAAGSLDGDAPRLVAAIASRLASANSHVRLKVISKDSAIEAAKAFSTGEADLAVMRSDAADVSSARTLLRIGSGVVLIIAPPGSAIESLDDLKGKIVGVVGGDVNRRVTDTFKELGANVQFKDLTPDGIGPAFKAKQIQALMVVIPISEKYLAMIRGIAQPNAKQKARLLPIDAAEAIANVARYFESYELPKGTLRGVPPMPEEDLTTLRVPFYLVAKKTLDDSLAAELAKTVMETRRDLVGEFPILAQVSAPSTESDAYIPIHPGAKLYFDGDEKSFFDKYGDQIFYGSMALGSLTSALAATWKFMGLGPDNPKNPLNPLYELAGRVRAARNESDLEAVEEEIDNIIRSELEKYSRGDTVAADAAALSLATHRLEHLIAHRRTLLAAGQAPAAASTV